MLLTIETIGNDKKEMAEMLRRMATVLEHAWDIPSTLLGDKGRTRAGIILKLSEPEEEDE